MPTYTYTCQVCGETLTRIRRIADRHNPVQCTCGQAMDFRVTACGFVAPDWNFEGYKCVATGQEITSDRQRTQVMKENGLVDAREFGEPDFEQLDEDRTRMHDKVASPDIPQDLQDAMKREGLDDLL